MSDKIIVSKKHGLNPCIAICSQCGKETGEVLLLGKINKYKCNHCGSIILGRSHGESCPNCNSCNVILSERDIRPERSMIYGLCKECKTQNALHTQIVADGGIYWRCTACKSSGVIRANKFTETVRDSAGVMPPKPCGVEFDEQNCPQCKKRREKKNNN